MISTALLLTIGRWLGYFTLFCAALTVLALILKWGFRFRLVGVTGFMTVLTAGTFALSLGLHTRTEIPGAIHYSRIFDRGAAQVVIAVPPTVTAEQLEATLRQAAADLFSSGRSTQGESQLTVRARTVLHPEPGVSQPFFLGQVKRSLFSSNDNDMVIEIDQAKFAQLPKPTA
ncbi:Ycf51 family protein [Kovacikia minuta CCNUW1]|uniref:Ycf51 family protein n=1 Tax=Kovacikia minuta TaxID=2931930 RepID=UPI001CC93D9A|nr:Ycf51 family protein [Kovacikia minuta]UBF26930.1 Ycf51 family protein [Kovacikia minuta CCNUW1]